MAKAEIKNALGIYISPREIAIAQVKISKEGRPEPEHLVRFPTGFTVKEGMLRPLSLNNDFFNEKASWIAPFNKAVKQVSWNSSLAVVTLSPQFAILRYFVMPCVDRKFWNKSIPLESKKYIPVSFDEVVYDFDAVPIDGGKKLGVLFGLTQRKSVEFIINTLKSAGLDLSTVEITPASLERLFGFIDPKDHDVKGYLHFSGGGNSMLFSHGGYPVLYRETEGDPSGTMSERRRLDLKGAVQFVDRYVGGKAYKNICLSGEGAEGWKAPAEKEAETIPVVLWDPAALCGMKDSSSTGLFAVGAAIRDKAAGKLKLDISGLSAAINTEKAVQNYIWNIALVLGGFLLLLSIISQLKLFKVNSELASIRSQVENVPELQGLDPETIKLQIDMMRTNAQTLNLLLSNTDVIAPKLSAIADLISPDLWVQEIRYNNTYPISQVQGGGRDLTIRGETFLKKERKNSVANNFMKSLKAAPEFKSFASPSTIDLKIISEETFGAAGFRPDMMKKGPEAGEFTINCVGKRN
ncbi:MAG TPA: hypothetical protein DCZ92_13020 [Elusimicrobia bacterium]|nr:MAG: hypothetical protein A2016_00715 [Elusimicrobia bacterium GWF2_62_30]HBA61706.1 hypothetical protein [Elusimicrobiota bacterium]